MVVGPAAGRPVIFSLALFDRKVVDARDAQAHQTVLVEFPVLVAIAAEPVSAVVVPFVGKTHGDAVLTEGPDLFDEPVVEFARPLSREKRLDRFAALQELGAVAPAAVRRIGECDARGVAGVPGIFGHARLLGGSSGGKGRKRRTAHIISPSSIRRSYHRPQADRRTRFIYQSSDDCPGRTGVSGSKPFCWRDKVSSPVCAHSPAVR